MKNDTDKIAAEIRRDVLRMTHASRSSHIGSSLSVADILAVLYNDVMTGSGKNPDMPSRDRLIISKGHASAATYAVLGQFEYIPRQSLDKFCQDGSLLLGHVSHAVPGVEFSTGSLGHGLSVGAGMALTAKRQELGWKTYVVLSDGELNEGSVWEAALFSAHHGLSNLTAIIDYNKIQSFGAVEEVIRLEPLGEKWSAFGWSVVEVDGHDTKLLSRTLLGLPLDVAKPNVIIAHTVKGKGVSFMENSLAWHYKSPSDEELELGLKELGQQK